MEVEKVGWHRDVFNTITMLTPDVVHLQHEYGLYDIDDQLSTDLLDLLVLLHLNNVPTVITYHSVYSTLSKKELVFMNLSLQLVDAGIGTRRAAEDISAREFGLGAPECVCDTPRCGTAPRRRSAR